MSQRNTSKTALKNCFLSVYNVTGYCFSKNSKNQKENKKQITRLDIQVKIAEKLLIERTPTRYKCFEFSDKKETQKSYKILYWSTYRNSVSSDPNDLSLCGLCSEQQPNTPEREGRSFSTLPSSRCIQCVTFEANICFILC